MKKEEPKLLTLSNIHHGAALEMFEGALDQVLENIKDPNTDHKAKRGIKLEFSFVTNEERNVSDVVVQCKTALAGMKGVQSFVHIGRHAGKTVAVEQPTQEEMFPTSKPLDFTKKGSDD